MPASSARNTSATNFMPSCQEKVGNKQSANAGEQDSASEREDRDNSEGKK